MRSPAFFSGDNLATFDCVVVCRTQKSRERAQSFLTDEHLQRLVRASQDFQDEPSFTRVVPMEEIRAKEGNLSIPLYAGGKRRRRRMPRLSRLRRHCQIR
ncbi:MAG: N-6 DNA methylase [Verrucomicrobiaceae bacterium]|nr:N-6 DNA methylase [Verrucomicrobiaceae bacterium]